MSNNLDLIVYARYTLTTLLIDWSIRLTDDNAKKIVSFQAQYLDKHLHKPAHQTQPTF